MSATEKTVAIVLNEWDSQGYQAYLDFCGFLVRGIKGGPVPPGEAQRSAEVVVGMWVMLNIKGSEPSKKELEVGIGHRIDVLWQYGWCLGIAAASNNGLMT